MWIREISSLILLVGLTSCYPQSRVVNGTDSDITKFPFVASLRSQTSSHICGCCIIAPRWILTAAHCVVGRNASSLSVQYALTVINASGPNIGYIKSVHVHEDYNASESYANDIALLELAGTLVFNFRTVGPVTLPAQNYETPQEPEGAPGVLVGWGYNETNGRVQRNLQEVPLKIYSDSECYSRHNGSVTSDHICGGVDEGWKGQCNGDSGGPLSYVLPTGLVQVGIVSWSIKPCAVYPYPGVYTKVSHYVDWIHRTMNSAK